MATIKEVATRAGVSIKTVSRVLNAEPYVRAQLRERVETAAAELGYRPNQAARRLAGGRSFLIAHLYDNPNPHYISEIHAGAARRCRELGYHLVVEPVDSGSTDIIDAIDRLVKALAPDGILLTPPLSDRADLIALLERMDIAVIAIAAAPGIDASRVYVDERAAGRTATAHLIGLGHRDIAFVRGHPDHRAAAERFDGYREALADAGLPVDARFVAQGYFDLRSGMQAAQALLGAPQRPSAIFAANDEMAVGALIVARELGIDVPGSLSVVGYDDLPTSRLIWPALTTVHQPIQDLGRAAVTVLIEGGGRVDLSVAFDLIVRDSTAPPPGR